MTCLVQIYYCETAKLPTPHSTNSLEISDRATPLMSFHWQSDILKTFLQEMSSVLNPM